MVSIRFIIEIIAGKRKLRSLVDNLRDNELFVKIWIRCNGNYFEISSLNDAEKLNVVQVYLHTGETSSYQLD